MDPPNLRKYGVPIYAAGWVPNRALKSLDDNADREGGVQYYVVLAGGGGEGRSGIPNAVLTSSFDWQSNCLSPQPIGKLGFGSDLPYRMLVHPGGDGLLCALPTRCRFYEWDNIIEDGSIKLSLKESEMLLPQLENIEQQLSLSFNNESSVLALGGEEGKLRVFNWPSMKVILDEAEVHPSVKDLCFSLDGKFLVSLGRGSAKVWDIDSAKLVASLPKEDDEAFVSCRFSHAQDDTSVLYIAAIKGSFGCIQKWNAISWKKTRSTKIPCESVSSFDASPDGKLLAIGTAQGDVLILSANSVKVLSAIKRAHLGIVTTLAFSKDSRVLVSASMDSSARVTAIDSLTRGGGKLSVWMIILVVLLAVAAYFIQRYEILKIS